MILADPAVESLSSFIGADGTNTTLNSGRFSINLKPIGERKISAADLIRRLQTKLANVQGIDLYMVPVQNITVDDRVSRTQYQYTLEDPDQNELNDWTSRFVDQLKKLPELEDVATDQQDQRPRDQSGDRSPQRLSPRHRSLNHRQHPLRRVRPAANQHHVHAGESISRGARKPAAVSAGLPTS